MDMVQVIGIGMTAVLLILVVRRSHPELAVQITIVVAGIVFFLVLDKLRMIIELFTEMAKRAGIGEMYLIILLKIIGISYLVEFGAQVCRDAGEGAIASKIELAGKVMILVMAVPIIAFALDTILRLMP
ncbi:MAG: stage III sporulation protein AD [Selenomonadales bacterium]|jgi:stage III sporulation protein AD|nr:stage III sporulation protein AD [Selenomonadales bacterium]MBQ5636602.1 stage III sporulation protein AD [Selenomonadales bacterium]MBR0325063.1 stage III sporulation protein AD [Selenomonadales bacterium]